MDSVLRERLRLVVYVALRVAPKRMKHGLVEREALKADAATGALAEAVIEAVLRGYDVAEKPYKAKGAGEISRGPTGS